MEMWIIIVCSFTVENVPRSTSPSKPTAPTTIADSGSCLDTKDPPQPSRKKIVLVRKKPQISTTSSSDQKPLTVVSSSDVSSSGVNREASMSDGEEQAKMNGGTRSELVEDRPGVKRIKLSSKSSDEGVHESKGIGNQLSDLSVPVECRLPLNIDTTCIEMSVPLEERRRPMGEEHGRTDTGGPQLAGKQLDEMEHVRSEEELSSGLRERKESIDADLKSLLSPMEEKEEERVVGGKRPSIAEMKAEMYVHCIMVPTCVVHVCLSLAVFKEHLEVPMAPLQ